MHKLRFLCLFPILFTVDIDQSLRWYWFWYWGRQIQALWSVFHLWYWIIILQLYSHFRQIDCFFLFVFSLIDLFIITNSYFVENSLCLWIFLSDSVSVSLSFCLSIFLFLLLSLSLFLSLFLSLSLSLSLPPPPPPPPPFYLVLSVSLFWSQSSFLSFEGIGLFFTVIFMKALPAVYLPACACVHWWYSFITSWVKHLPHHK